MLPDATASGTGLWDPRVVRVFMEFPVALAIVQPAGHVDFTNARFNESFERSCLATAPMLDLIRQPGNDWRMLDIAGRNGTDIPVRAQAMRVGERLLVAIEELPGGMVGAGLATLHVRILELEQQTAIDYLTGAWNRAHLDRVVEAELARSQRYRKPVSLVLLDIDHFKAVNDRHGHQRGDALLRELVQLLQAHIRAGDLLFRWGGEEFVVLTANCGYRAAARLAENLRSLVALHAFSEAGGITLSLGVAEHQGTESAAEWFHRCDALLYVAKQGGRNRVEVEHRGNSDEWAAEAGVAALRLQWLEGYECGEPRIDQEHQELFELANALIGASFARQAAPEAFTTALERLLAAVGRHFMDEEQVLAAHGYSGLDAHRAAHATLLARAAQLRSRAADGASDFGELVEFLAKELVAAHIFGADRDYFPLFQRGG